MYEFEFNALIKGNSKSIKIKFNYRNRKLFNDIK